MTLPLDVVAYLIRLEFCAGLSDCELSLFGQSIRIDGNANKVSVGENHFPFLTERNRRELTLIVDSSSVELFSGRGEAMMTAPFLCDYNINEMTLSSSSDTRLSAVEISRLSSL